MNNRFDKMNEEIVKALSEIFRDEIKDPRIDGMVTVADAKITNDLSHCTIYLSIYNSKDKKVCFQTICKCAGFIRKKLAEKVDIRIMPELHFKLDETLDYVDKMNEIFKTIE